MFERLLLPFYKADSKGKHVGLEVVLRQSTRHVKHVQHFRHPVYIGLCELSFQLEPNLCPICLVSLNMHPRDGTRVNRNSPSQMEQAQYSLL